MIKFMKFILRYISCLLFAFMSCACVDDIIGYEENHGYEINMQLITSTMQTKGEMPGVDELNENKIESVHYFFFPKDPVDPTQINKSVQPSHWGVVRPGTGVNGSTSLKLKVSETVFNNVIFPRPHNECDVYIIINLPDGITIDNSTNKSLNSLYSLSLQENFTNHKQDLFVMTGFGTLNVADRSGGDEDNPTASGTIVAKRIAAKLTVNINVIDKVDYEGTEWESQPGEMKMVFHNGVSNAKISADPADVDPVYFQIGEFKTNTALIPFEKDDNTGAWTCEPFYTYPIQWHIGDENEPYLMIRLPWTHEVTDGSGTRWETKETYYKVIFGGELLARNTWSDLIINLNAPGNFEEFPEYNVLILDVDYKVSDWSVVHWGDGNHINTEILESRYIVVDRPLYVLDNQAELKIPISSSHECEIVDAKTYTLTNQATITRPDYRNETVSTSEVAWASDKWTLEVISSDIDGTYVRFYHEMNNDITSKQIDFAPYTIRFRVRHKDKPGVYFRDVEIVQNPAMMITHEKNPGDNTVSDTQTDDDDKGYVFVNNNQKVDWVNGTSKNRWDMVRSCGDGGNHNPNMYVISTTVPFDDYILTDPRKTTKTTLTGSSGLFYGTNKTLKADVNGKKLTNYYETVDGDESHVIIAPKFRIASSYGKCWNSIAETEARRRCAAYQERGYPAGRWRIPTLAEMRYIATLSNYKIIPELFTPDNKYWTSDGVIKYGNNMTITSETTGAVRCVYDEWYWEQTETPKVDVDKFTWGDMER